jgi:hypothetical protein
MSGPEEPTIFGQQNSIGLPQIGVSDTQRNPLPHPFTLVAFATPQLQDILARSCGGSRGIYRSRKQVVATDEGKTMRKLGLLIMAGQFAVAMGCSSNSNNASGGTGGKASTTGGAIAMGGSGNVSSTTTGRGGAGGANAAGGTSGAAAGGATATATGGTSAGAGGSTSTSTCVIPSCLSKLFTGCVGTGACVYQEVDGATNSENTCFSNGVKWIGNDDYSNDLKTVTVTHGGLTCYSMQYSGNDVLNAVDVLTVKDASGAIVATEGVDPVTYSGTIVTCTGGDPVELDPSCSGTPADVATIVYTGQDCTVGTCSP